MGGSSTFSRRSKPATYKASQSGADEALFGSGGKNAIVTSGGKKSNPIIITKEESNRLKAELKSGKAKDIGILTKSELDRIKGSIKITTKDDAIAERRLREEIKDQQLAASNARKEKMKALDLNRDRKKPLTHFQKDEKEQNETLLTKARKLQDEEHDDVKHMNKMVLYSKCVTIRDKQLTEHTSIEERKKEEERRNDLMMEIERLKAIDFQIGIDEKKKQERLQGIYIILYNYILLFRSKSDC